MNRLWWIVVCGLSLGCAERARVSTTGGARPGADAPWAPVVVVADLPTPPPVAPEAPGPVEQQLVDDAAPATVLDPVRDGAFLRNDFVGNIRFGGGIVRTGAVALETRARLIELQPLPTLRQQGVEWLTGVLTERLGPATAAAWPTATLRHVSARGSDPDDGRDNLNLPRTTLVPEPVPDAPAGRVLVPFLRSYYTHNGGWFLGQRWGCLAGARVDVLVVLYDGGRPVWWTEAAGRSLGGAAQATPAELDQRLLDAEAQVRDALRARLR